MTLFSAFIDSSIFNFDGKGIYKIIENEKND